MFYAEFRPYGITTMSYRDRVYWFDTEAERDLFVDGNSTAVAITFKDARRSYDR